MHSILQASSSVITGKSFEARSIGFAYLWRSAHQKMPFEKGSEYKGPYLPLTVDGKHNYSLDYSRALGDRRLPKSNLLTSLKWCASVLLTIFVCLRITRGVVTDGTVKSVTVFPDLYEASVLELQAGLDAGHFSSVDLVKVLTDSYFFGLFIYIHEPLSDLFCTNRGSQSSRTSTSRSLGTESICVDSGCCIG